MCTLGLIIIAFPRKEIPSSVECQLLNPCVFMKITDGLRKYFNSLNIIVVGAVNVEKVSEFSSWNHFNEVKWNSRCTRTVIRSKNLHPCYRLHQISQGADSKQREKCKKHVQGVAERQKGPAGVLAGSRTRGQGSREKRWATRWEATGV